MHKAGGNSSASLAASREIASSENPAKTAAAGCGGLSDPPLTPTAGFEESQEMLGKTQFAAVGGNAGGNTLDEKEILAAWPMLSESVKQAILRLCREN